MNWGNNRGYANESWSCDAREDVGIIGNLDKGFGKSSKSKSKILSSINAQEVWDCVVYVYNVLWRDISAITCGCCRILREWRVKVMLLRGSVVESLSYSNLVEALKCLKGWSKWGGSLFEGLVV